MKTTENNKLIAKFLNELTTNSEGQVKEDLEKLDFHYNWNSLMRAVHKISILDEFQEWEFNSLFWEVFCQLDITEVYNQAVLFIEYYNEIRGE